MTSNVIVTATLNMPVYVTIKLDSGFIVSQEPKVEIGYFQSQSWEPDLLILADGELVLPASPKLGMGRVEVVHTDYQSTIGTVGITQAFISSILQLDHLYGDVPEYRFESFDCLLIFTSGRFCASLVKDRRFVEWDVHTGAKTGNERVLRAITHDIAVHYELLQGEELLIRREDRTVLFTTRDLPSGVGRVDIDIVADNSTAEKYYKEALDFSGRRMCWMPNFGDPPPFAFAAGLGGRHRARRITRTCKECEEVYDYVYINENTYCKNEKIGKHKLKLS